MVLPVLISAINIVSEIQTTTLRKAKPHRGSQGQHHGLAGSRSNSPNCANTFFIAVASSDSESSGSIGIVAEAKTNSCCVHLRPRNQHERRHSTVWLIGDNLWARWLASPPANRRAKESWSDATLSPNNALSSVASRSPLPPRHSSAGRPRPARHPEQSLQRTRLNQSCFRHTAGPYYQDEGRASPLIYAETTCTTATIRSDHDGRPEAAPQPSTPRPRPRVASNQERSIDPRRLCGQQHATRVVAMSSESSPCLARLRQFPL